MGILMKKLFSNQVSVPSPRQAQLRAAVSSVRSSIDAGLSNPSASTGTPISSLSGGARMNALLSNMGGGSKASGGGGMEAGMRMLDRYSRLSGALQESMRQTGLPGKK